MGKTLLLASDLDDYLRSCYGRISPVRQEGGRMPSLPKHVRESVFFKKAS